MAWVAGGALGTHKPLCVCLSSSSVPVCVRYTVFSRLNKNHKITMKKQREVIFCLSFLSGWFLFSVSCSSVSLCFISLLLGVIHCLHLSLFFHSGPPSFSRFLSFLKVLALNWDRRGTAHLFFSSFDFLTRSQVPWVKNVRVKALWIFFQMSTSNTQKRNLKMIIDLYIKSSLFPFKSPVLDANKIEWK